MSILKQLAEWVTGLKHKFLHDYSYSASIKILFFLTICGIATSVILAFFVVFFFHHLIESTGQSIVRTPFQILTQDLFWQFFSVLTFITICNVVCTYMIVQIALLPVSQALQLQKRFISRIAHELRTPLSLLRINNELALMSRSTDVKILELLHENIVDIDRINETLNTLLLYDRLIKSQALLFGTVNLRQILLDTTSRLSEIAKHKNINLILYASTKVNEIHGNKTALEQAFFNVIENAIAYSPKKSDIVITITEQEKSVLISIKDAGIGIPTQDLPHLFEPFYRNDKTVKSSGVGVGLAIVDQIIRLHNGLIAVSSSDSGTEFEINLPLVSSTRS